MRLFAWGTYNVQGTQGGLWASITEAKWRWFDPKEAPEQRVIRTPLTAPDGEPAYCSERLPWQEGHWVAGEGENPFESAVRDYYTNIYNHLTNGEALIVTPEQVRRQICVIQRAHELNPLDKFC